MMLLDQQQMALATQCLWSLQETAPEIEGLLFTHVDGLTLTTTLPGSEKTERLAAVSTALFLLSEQASETWRSGEALEVQMKLRRAPVDLSHLTIKPVGPRAILVALYQHTSRYNRIKADLDLASTYLLAVMAGDTPPRPVNWHSR